MKSERIAFSIGIIAIFVFVLGNVAMAMTNSNVPGYNGGPTEPQQVVAERTVTETEKEIIPFETETIDDNIIDYGKTAVRVEGVNGERTYIYKVTYKDEEEISRELVSKEITKQPVTKVIANGTKIVWSCRDVTSYDRNSNNDNLCTSSTGEQRYVGDCSAVALDPNYHPGQSGARRYNGCAW